MQPWSFHSKDTSEKLATLIKGADEAAMKIFDMVIMPLLTYNSIINLKLTKTQSDKLLSLERRASRIISKKVKKY